jgi:hypothetical protein
MVPLSVLTVATGGECLSSDVFSLSEIIHFGSLKFTADRFSGLSLSPMGDGSYAVVMGSTDGGLPSPPWAMTGDSTEGFDTASEEEGRINLPSPRRHDMGGFNCPRNNHIMAEDHANHSNHGDHYTALGGATVEHHPTPRATVHSSRGDTSTSPCLVNLCRVGGSAMAQLARQPVSDGRDSTA